MEIINEIIIIGDPADHGSCCMLCFELLSCPLLRLELARSLYSNYSTIVIKNSFNFFYSYYLKIWDNAAVKY